MKDLRIELKFKNQRLYEEVEAHGGARKFGKWAGVNYQAVLSLLGCHVSPKKLVDLGWRQGVIEWREVARKIAEAVGIDAEDLFPIHLYPPPRTKRPATLAFAVDSTVMISMDEARGLSAPREFNPEHLLGQRETHDVVEGMLATLTPREAAVLRMRFGLGEGAVPLTLHEVGEELGVPRERVRQIEMKARRKISHPSRLRLLRGTLSALDAAETES